MARHAWTLVVALAITTPRIAHADSPATAVFSEAKGKYGAGDYAAAAALFVKAYELDPDPAYLFNVAQSYRLADDCVKAADYYQRFLDKIPNPPNLDAVRGWLDEAKKCAALRQPAKQPDTHQQPPPPHHDVVKPKPAPSKTLAIVVTGVGVVALGAAGYFTWDTSHIASKRDTFAAANCHPAPMLPCDGNALRDFDADGHRARAFAVAGYAVGGLAVVGVVLWMKAGRAEQPPIAVGPTKGGAMISAGLAF